MVIPRVKRKIAERKSTFVEGAKSDDVHKNAIFRFQAMKL
jgi:hypothetical protein